MCMPHDLIPETKVSGKMNKFYSITRKNIGNPIKKK
jgi:hypothetical protein